MSDVLEVITVNFTDSNDLPISSKKEKGEESEPIKVWYAQSPLDGVDTHELYLDEYKMYVIVGHPKSLTQTIENNLIEEIQRGINSLMFILIFSVATLFFFFAWFFEKRL